MARTSPPYTRKTHNAFPLFLLLLTQKTPARRFSPTIAWPGETILTAPKAPIGPNNQIKNSRSHIYICVVL